ncbi:MAG: polysaccharide biosynthesis/export family protein, partial [Gemmataceae bacterium]
MSRVANRTRLLVVAFGLTLGLGPVGCQSMPKQSEPIPDLQLPKELNKVSHPIYTVESPDILLIDTIRALPRPPYKLQPLDSVYLRVPGTETLGETIDGIYTIEEDGSINIGAVYGGRIRVVDKTVPEVEKILNRVFRDLFVKYEGLVINLAAVRGSQQISGQHLVRPDGTVGLGSYGAVYVAGMTLSQTKATIEAHLSQFLYKPEVVVDVFAFNSKFYYVISDFAG